MHQRIIFFPLFISLLTTLSITTSQQQCNPQSTMRIGYWLPQSNNYSPLSLINTSLYTHLYYYSLSILDLPPENQLLSTFSLALKENNPTLKTLLSIATDDRRSDASNAAFSSMASDRSLRAKFIESSISLARANAFDGLDLAWRFPSSPSDMANLEHLLVEWRARINEESQEQPLILTATVYFSNHLFLNDVYYPIDAISAAPDWINVLCFDYSENSKATTTADAAVYNSVSHFSTSYGITSWLDSGVPSCKLVMGIPLYGRCWFLKNKAKNGVGAPVVAEGPRQKLSNQTGIMAYFEIEEVLKVTGSISTYDNETVSAFFHTGGKWVGFDSLEVVEEKIGFALRNQLLGYFLWPISYDDPNYSVSKRASDAWLRNLGSDREGTNGYEEALSPVELPPQDNAPINSAALSGFTRSSLASQNFRLCSCLLLFLLFYFRSCS